MKIAICDNEKIICSYIADLIHKIKPEAIIKIFNSSEKILFSTETFDIYLLDIKGINGLSIAQSIRQRQAVKSVIIFITGYREYMEAAFDVNAFHYLVKPVQHERFERVFASAWNEALTYKNQPDRSMLLKIGNVQRKIIVDDILFVESNNRKVNFHTSTDVYEVYNTLESVAKTLGDSFYRCHRCFLVNLSKIVDYNSDEIKLINGDKLLLSRKKYSEFVKIYLKYLKLT